MFSLNLPRVHKKRLPNTRKKNSPLDTGSYHPRLGADRDGITMNNTADL